MIVVVVIVIVIVDVVAIGDVIGDVVGDERRDEPPIAHSRQKSFQGLCFKSRSISCTSS